jgi:hypothetical protein
MCFRFVSFRFLVSRFAFRFSLFVSRSFVSFPFRFACFCFVSRFVSFRFVSFRFVSFRFVSFRFVSFRFVSFRFVSFRFVSFRLVALLVFVSFSFSFRFVFLLVRDTDAADGKYDGQRVRNMLAQWMSREAHQSAVLAVFHNDEGKSEKSPRSSTEHCRSADHLAAHLQQLQNGNAPNHIDIQLLALYVEVGLSLWQSNL